MSISKADARLSVSAADQEMIREKEAARLRAEALRRRAAAGRAAIRLASLVIVLGGWEYFGRETNPVLFTYPTAIGRAAVKMIASGELWKYLSQSLIVLFAGLGLASVFGIALGLVMARVRVIDIALDTYITALYSIPSVALVPVLVLWFGFEATAKTAVIFLFTFAVASATCGRISCCPRRCRSSSPV
jgi:NitT/TauT family transport system permease protein